MENGDRYTVSQRRLLAFNPDDVASVGVAARVRGTNLSSTIHVSTLFN